jgi:hypothetical protein
MTQGQKDYANRKALEVLDAWLEVTGAIHKHTGWYYELQSIIEDAVDIGAKTALGIEVKVSDYLDNDK